MKNFKKAIAILLAIVFALSLTACHQKDEVAVSSGDYKVTSAMYSYFLVMADSEAKSVIDANDEIDTSAKNFSYYKQKIEDKPYETYVKDLAMEKCLNYITLAKLCDEAEVKLDKETKEGWQSTAEYYWNYSYGSVMLQNGVAYSTYEKIMLNDALYSLYFDHLYSEGGEKAVDAESVKAALGKHYAAVYMITHDYSEEKEPDVDAMKADLEKYVTSLKNGEDFATVLATYKNDKGIKDESSSTTSSTTTSSTTSSTTETSSADASSDSTSSTTSSEEKEEEKKPVDANVTILTDYEETYSGEATNFAKFETVSKMELGAVELIQDTDAKAFYIVVKKDVNTDPYYLESLTDEILYLLKSDEYDKFLKDTAGKLNYDVSNYAINQFKVKKINDGSEQ